MSQDPDFLVVPKQDQPSLARWWILLGLLIPFCTLSFLGVNSAPGDPSDRPAPAIPAALMTITGPFVGSIARHGQSCCLDVSLTIAACCGPFLALGLFAQKIPFPFRRGRQVVRLMCWTLGWFVWLEGGQLSLLHALF